MRTWGGRFSGETDARVADFTRSIQIDAALAADDIAGSIAHVHGLGVEWARHAPSAILLKRQIGAPVDDTVKVMPFDGGEPRVEIRRRALGGEHCHRLRP